MLDNEIDKEFSDLPLSRDYKIFLAIMGFLLLLLIIAFTLSFLGVYPFDAYKRDYAPPGISTGQNESPYTPI